MSNQCKGQVLVGAIIMLVILGILIPTLVNLVRQESLWTTKQKKSTLAFQLAETAVDRGIWKLKESTTTFRSASVGTTITNYNFDKKFTDVAGGYYRIKFSSGPSTFQVTIIGEGKDVDANQVRAIKCVVENKSVPGAIISGGAVSWSKDLQVHWGPIMAQGDITLNSAQASQYYFPRKFSKQVVSANPSYPRDTNGLTPPNTDNLEWWSNYPVPDLPEFDFAALRESAQATNTLNVYGCNKSGGTHSATWTTEHCNSNDLCHDKSGSGSSMKGHFFNIDRHPFSKLNYVWYWDGDVAFTGDTGADGCGLYGTVIVRGNLYWDTGDNLSFTGNIPSTAWKEYQKFDTAATGEYPGDNGLASNSATFNFGSQTWTGSSCGEIPSAANTDVGIRGFVYIGGNTGKGNFYINNVGDFAGAVWVTGNVIKSSALSDDTLIFFDSALSVPTLNVVISRVSWQEVVPTNPTTW